MAEKATIIMAGVDISPAFTAAVNVGVRQTYADLGMTIMDNFGLTGLEFGTSFLSELR